MIYTHIPFDYSKTYNGEKLLHKTHGVVTMVEKPMMCVELEGGECILCQESELSHLINNLTKPN